MRAVQPVLSLEEKQLLVAILFRNHFAIELVVSEINDIECGKKEFDLCTYKISGAL
ncbi:MULTISPECIES: antirepressor AbbA [Aeribacillus]|uniref:antirepressor AbbA n=1 Tax=Aeribacillus TaxID=1055323 RepID=UPI001F2D0347|nr:MULTISPECIES: antirepressor AbbA [Aeribacillus]MED0701530.1 antirepressor AbbA [Aeribacillus composti]